MYPVGYDPNAFVSEPGDRYMTRYIGEVDRDTGMIKLAPSGQDDLWQLHSACAEQCDINYIVRRFQNGDVSVLNRVQGNYLDVVGMPKNLREINDVAVKLRTSYELMSDDLKKKFGSYEAWLDALGSMELAVASKSSDQVPVSRSESVSGSDEQQSSAATT